MISESISVTIPAFNEEETLESVARQALSVLRDLTTDYELLIVDDGSTDRTSSIADRLAIEESAHVRVIHHPRNRGFAGALQSCYSSASKDWIFHAPADKQVDLNVIKDFVAARDGADVVVGYRANRADPVYRKFNSFLFHSMCRILFGIKLKSISTSKLYRRELVQSITIEALPSSASIEPEVIFKLMQRGARFKQIGMTHYPRAGGKAKGADIRLIYRTFGELFRLWWKLRVRRVLEPAREN